MTDREIIQEEINRLKVLLRACQSLWVAVKIQAEINMLERAL